MQQRFSTASWVAALLTLLFLSFLTACGGGGTTTSPVAQIVISPASLSMNQGQVVGISAIPQNSTGSVVAADITFTSSNTALANISSGGLICAGAWDANIITCTPNLGTPGVGQVTITATSGSVSSTMTVYVHEQVDRVVVNSPSTCTSMGMLINPSATAISTSAPGCSPTAPCDITSTVGPITIGSVNPQVAASASGIESTFNSVTNSPTYSSGGTITGSAGQTCNLSDFSIGGSLGINPTFSAVTNSPTYTSGGTVSGSGGQTCTLSNFNGVTGALATVALIGTNTIPTGTQLTVTATGFGATTPPTTASFSNGTATCSGTVNVITTLTSTGGVGGVTDATATVTLSGSNTIATGTRLTITNPGFGAVSAPTTAILSSGTATCSGTANVITALNNASGFKSQNPGATAIYASVSGVNSVAAPFNVCPVASIRVHSASDATTSFTLAPAATQALTAEVLDSSGVAIAPSLTWSSNVPHSASAATASTGSPGGTVTAVVAGTTAITATCSNPDCNIGLPPQYSLNTATVQVTGNTSTKVYAASTNSTSLVPILTDTNTAQTAITLPFVPNSMVASPAGDNIYLGSATTLMQVATATSAVSTVPIPGSVVAISPDGNYVVISDPTSGAVFVFNVTTSTFAFRNFLVVTSAAAFTPDSKTSWFFHDNQGYANALSAPSQQFTLPYTAGSIAFHPTGTLGYITTSDTHQIDVRSSCDHSDLQSLAGTAPTLVSTIPTGNGVVVADSPNLDVVTSSDITGGCPTTATSTLATFDLGVGGFTATQMFVSPDSSKVWLISNLPQLVGFNLNTSTPFSIPFANGATPLSGGVRMDGQQLYIGASDGTVHRIDAATLGDSAQITVGLKDSAGNATNPNLVVVLP